MLRAYKYRIYPTAEQMILMAKHFGCVRMLYNKALGAKQVAYSQYKLSLSNGDLSGWLTSMKKDSEKEWLNDVNAQALQSSLRNLDTAYQKFFKKETGFPKFKKKYSRQSFHCPQNVYFDNGKLSIPKFREGIDINVHRSFKGTIKTVTFSKQPSGAYMASILVDTNRSIPVKKGIAEATTIGLDLGLKSFIVGSDGLKEDNPKCLKASEVKKDFWKKRLSRKEFVKNSEGKMVSSKRRERCRMKVAKIEEHIVNQRKDFLHKLSDAITKQYDTICMEDLKVKNMMKNRHLAKSISDVGWGMFVTFIKYKSEWRGKNFLQIGTFEASTKTCSCCDHVNHDLTLADREWDCPNCKAKHDRDINAAINIKRFALNNWRTECALQDIEVPPLSSSKRKKGKRTREMSKVQNIVLQVAS